ncbi:ABC transporter substrate-binding protein [Microbacterium sp. CJ88]|uniref:ABC transporter substrate-binding protein n=1 Tax=Microbacterium sp. CJ88 TaxID=3445672 RepID=UPI003F65BA3C
MNHRTRALSAVSALAALTLGIAACSGASTASSAGGSSAAPQPIVLYSAMGEAKAVVDAFIAKTGIPVNLVEDSTGPLLTKVAAEKNNPQWTALWVDGATAFAALDQQGQLAPYTTKADLSAVGKSLVPASNAYVPTGTTVVPGVIYNAAAGGSVPQTWDDLLTSAYSGKVGMNDPAKSGPTYPLIAGLMDQMGGQTGGVAAGEAYLTKLKSNGLQVFPTNGDTLHALENGQISYGLVQSSAALGEVAAAAANKTAGFDPKVAFFPKATLLPSAFGIDKSASPQLQSEAQQLVEFILSPEGQQAMLGADPTGDSLYWPIVNGVKPLAGVTAFPTDYNVIDPYFWGPLQSEVVTWFGNNIK